MLFTGLNSPRITIGLHWHPLRKPVPTGAVHRVRCVCISNRVHLCDVDPQAHICDVNPHTDTDWCACGCGTTVEADHADSHTRLAFLIGWCIELDVMSFHGQNSSFFESRSFGKHYMYIQVSPPNNYDSRHQVSSQNLESRRRSKRSPIQIWLRCFFALVRAQRARCARTKAKKQEQSDLNRTSLNVAMWADDLLMWLKSAKEHSFISTRELSRDSSLTKNTCACVN